ncbi:SDR family NAD(P)-dependent oxidoreductase [Candidatus Acetothermia bacterium]|nr:SDR family NAD(P)-dependent oxidoreductase [Candidatus Acetothermia bacterium]MBI3643995.1 SDR family NAD(P)-dependent oxidoreductase [Candidatus Acetothermia bacterium]
MKLLTGCAGFIGSCVAQLLLDEGDEFIGIDNLNPAYDVRLKEWRLAQLKKDKRFSFAQLDITNQAKLRELFQKHDFESVINLAARAGVRQSIENPWTYFDTNVTGTLNLVELCKEFNVAKFVLASTSSIYGESERPFSESQPASQPLSPYAASKKAAEVLCHSYHYLHGLDVTVLRYFTVFGPAGRPDMSIFRFIRWIAEGEPLQLYGDGLQERDFTYVEDIARGTLLALKPVGYEIINLGGDHPASLKGIITSLEDLLCKKAKIIHLDPHPTDVSATWADISKAKSLLGWEPQIPLDEGLKRTVEWYFKNAQWAKELRLA